MTVLTDFADKLTEALKKAGYRNFGKLNNLEELYDQYKNLSPREMADQYAKEHDLERMNRAYRMLREIYDHPGEFTSLQNKSGEYGLPYAYVAEAVKDYTPVEMTGSGITTKYHWVSPEPPSFNSAVDFINLVDQFKNFKHDDSVKSEIKEAVENEIPREDFLRDKNFNHLQTFHALRLYNQYTSQYRKKIRNKKKNVVTEAKFKIPAEQVKEIKVNIEDEKIPLNGEPNFSEYHAFILEKENAYLRKINKQQRKLIKLLKNKLESIQ